MGLHNQAATEGMAPVGTVARAVGQVLRIGTYHVIKELQNPQLQPLAVKNAAALQARPACPYDFYIQTGRWSGGLAGPSSSAARAWSRKALLRLMLPGGASSFPGACRWLQHCPPHKAGGACVAAGGWGPARKPVAPLLPLPPLSKLPWPPSTEPCATAAAPPNGLPTMWGA